VARPIPEPTVAFQEAFGKSYELELYRAKYVGARWVTTETEYWSATGSADQSSSRLEGGSLSKATMRRIAEIAGVTAPLLATNEEYIVTQILKVRKEFKKDRQYVETSWDKM
jgi:hypothetical protein